jgi:ribosomal protein L37AE/L43A
MTTCPCCSDSMLRHIRHHQVYWFCRSCWQEMPAYRCNENHPSNISKPAASMALQESLASMLA